MSLLLISSTGNEYVLKESDRLGQGAFGDVFKGIDKKRLQNVAIKRVSNTVLDRYGEEFIRCLGNEANILQEMGNGQHTVAIIDCFQSTNYVNIIMEYCDGGNLRDLVKSKGGVLEEPEAVAYLSEIVDGLYQMHKSGRMHRDLKLENIFLKEGHCKIGDFGFATKQQEAEQYVGTPEYMAPEIFAAGDGKTYNRQVDIWALGIMYHEMLFGNRPYSGPETQMRDIIYNNPYKPPQNAKISAESQDLLRQMLRFEPSERITIEDVKKHPLFRMNFSNDKSPSNSYYQKAPSTEDLGLSDNLKKSLTQSLTNDYVLRIYRKLNNYRQCCGFFLKLGMFILPYMRAGKNYILDELHIFTYYMLKFGHNKFAFLYECLDNKECPKNLLKHVETEYWSEFTKNEKFPVLKAETQKGKDLIEKIFISFRRDELGPYLQRAGRSTHELDTIYTENIYTDCTAGFTGKLYEAIYVLQKMSQSKKEMLSQEINKILVDLEFAQLIEDYMDNYEKEIEVEGYWQDRDRNADNLDLKRYLKLRTW